MARAERDRQAAEAAVARPRPVRAMVVRRWLGGAMIGAGLRVQGMPAPSLLAIDRVPARW